MAEIQIGILSLYYHNYNFGGLLQAYALQKYIQGEIGSCEQISYKIAQKNAYEKIMTRFQQKSIWEGGTLFIKRGIRRFLNIIVKNYMNKLLDQRIKRFAEFEKSIPHSERIYDRNTIHECDDSYSTFVTGSDQIWSDRKDLEHFLLDFASAHKRKVGYAASAGGYKYFERKEVTLRNLLDSFTAISVREKGLKKCLEEYTTNPMEVVLDPVFLLDIEEWKNTMIPPKIESPYILCYLLGDNVKQRNICRKIAKEKNNILVIVPSDQFRGCDYRFGDIRDYEAGPKEFLGLINGAEFVITDSFHGMAFSLIFKKQFLVFPRFSKTSSLNNNRITDMLEELGIPERMADSCNEAEEMFEKKIEYKKVNDILEQKKIDSRNWLIKSLQM